MDNLDTQNFKSIDSDIETTRDWVDNIYNKVFGDMFHEIFRLSSNMHDPDFKITDSELEWILTSLPLVLFQVSERLNGLRLEHEVIKLSRKRERFVKESAIRDELDINGCSISSSEMKSLVDINMTDYDIMLASYSSLISRVEGEISFSKELIMGAKKVWDSRRSSENSNPVGEVVVDDELPDYKPNSYIR